MANDICKWKENDSNGGWDTECGNWFFIEDVSMENNPEKDIEVCSGCDKNIEVSNEG